jgi:hypothetical protein
MFLRVPAAHKKALLSGAFLRSNEWRCRTAMGCGPILCLDLACFSWHASLGMCMSRSYSRPQAQGTIPADDDPFPWATLPIPLSTSAQRDVP